MSRPDYYRILNVSNEATGAEIENTYRRMAALFGPDVNPEPFAARIYAAAAEAYAVLSDPVRKSAYDRTRRPLHEETDTDEEGNGSFGDGWAREDDTCTEAEFSDRSPRGGERASRANAWGRSSEREWEDVEYSDIPEPSCRKKHAPRPPRHYVVERPVGGERMEREEAAARTRSYFAHWRFWAALSACMFMGYLISRTVAWGLNPTKKDSLFNLTTVFFCLAWLGFLTLRRKWWHVRFHYRNPRTGSPEAYPLDLLFKVVFPGLCAVYLASTRFITVSLGRGGEGTVFFYPIFALAFGLSFHWATVFAEGP